MSTRELINLLKFAQSQSYDVFCDNRHLYLHQIDETGVDNALKMAIKDLLKLEKEKNSLDRANRLLATYQMILNISVLADLASLTDLRRLEALKLQKLYKDTTRTILGQINPVYGVQLCEMKMKEFDNLIIKSAGYIKRAELAMVGICRALLLGQKVANREGVGAMTRGWGEDMITFKDK